MSQHMTKPIKVLQALHHVPPLHLHQASAITLSKIKCVLHVISLYIFARLQENLWIRFQVIEKAHVYDLCHYWQCWMGGNSKSRQCRVMVLVFCKLYHGDIHLYKVLRKYLEQFSSYKVDTNILQKSIFSKFSKSRLTRVTVLVFSFLSHNA